MARINVLSSTLASAAAGWRGTRSASISKQPELLLKLYEYEGCPFCRLVRQALTELDLDAIIYPCPQNGGRWRAEAEAVGGRRQFPLLVDDNTGTVGYESAEIVAYLRERYGRGRHRRGAAPGVFARAGSGAATVLRGLAGVHKRVPSRPPERLLELYSFESSPFSRLVRETLCELEIAYILRNMGKANAADMSPPWFRRRVLSNAPVGGRNRRLMMARTGRIQVPYLVDPNTNTALFESAAIQRYLRATYQR